MRSNLRSEMRYYLTGLALSLGPACHSPGEIERRPGTIAAETIHADCQEYKLENYFFGKPGDIRELPNLDGKQTESDPTIHVLTSPKEILEIETTCSDKKRRRILYPIACEQMLDRILESLPKYTAQIAEKNADAFTTEYNYKSLAEIGIRRAPQIILKHENTFAKYLWWREIKIQAEIELESKHN